MRLAKRKIKGVHYGAPIKGLVLDESQKPALLAKVRAGNQEACDLLIKGHINLAANIVGRYIATYNEDGDALFSAALVGVCDAVDKIRKGVMTHNNVTGYITDTIHGFISDELDKLRFIRIPRRTRHDHDYKIPDFVRHNLVECCVFDSNELEVEEIKEKLIESDRDREILDYRLSGYSDPEIADLIGVSTKTVFVYRREMQKRYQNVVD